MNKFLVQFAEITPVGLITKALKGVPATDVENKGDDTYVFEAEWGTDARNLNNLKGRIENVSGRKSVVDIREA